MFIFNGENSFDNLLFLRSKFHKTHGHSSLVTDLQTLQVEVSNITFVGKVAVSHNHLNRNGVLHIHLSSQEQIITGIIQLNKYFIYIFRFSLHIHAFLLNMQCNYRVTL